MSRPPFFGRVALAIASTLALACSSDTPTSPPTASQSLTAAAPPTISLYYTPYYLQHLCYPYIPYSVRGCPSGSSVKIINSGGGTLNWTSTKNATWLKRSPKYGTAPSTMQIWVDGRDLPPGEYDGRIKIWATGATNSPQSIYVHVRRY